MAISSRMMSGVMIGAVAIVALVACQSDAEIEPTQVHAEPTTISSQPQSTATPPPKLEPKAAVPPQPVFPPPPQLVRSKHSVELNGIYFDRFDGSTTKLSNASNALIDLLRDAIKPIYRASYEDPNEDDWLEDGDVVVGYVGHESGQAYAYPVKFLNFHELVNDEIDGVPLIVTYCPLCGSGIVFDRRVGDEVLLFGNTSALYNSDLVMFDHESGSYWFQTGGKAVVGMLTGSRLKPLASSVMTWGDWLEIYPGTKILSREQGLDTRPSQYLRDPFSTYANFINEGEDRYPFPVDGELVSDALRPAEIVLAVEIDDIERAYPPGRIGDAAVNDVIGNTPVVVFSRGETQVATVFSPIIETDHRKLEFEIVDGEFKDLQTSSVWNIAGVTTSGELEGERLAPLPSRRAFWFSISISNSEIEIFGD